MFLDERTSMRYAPAISFPRVMYNETNYRFLKNLGLCPTRKNKKEAINKVITLFVITSNKY